MEIAAMSELYKVGIKVWELSSSGALVAQFNTTPLATENGWPSLHLARHRGIHYDSVIHQNPKLSLPPSKDCLLKTELSDDVSMCSYELSLPNVSSTIPTDRLPDKSCMEMCGAKYPSTVTDHIDSNSENTITNSRTVHSAEGDLETQGDYHLETLTGDINELTVTEVDGSYPETYAVCTEEPLNHFARESFSSVKNVDASIPEVTCRVALSEELDMEWSSDSAHETTLQQLTPCEVTPEKCEPDAKTACMDLCCSSENNRNGDEWSMDHDESLFLTEEMLGKSLSPEKKKGKTNTLLDFFEVLPNAVQDGVSNYTAGKWERRINRGSSCLTKPKFKLEKGNVLCPVPGCGNQGGKGFRRDGVSKILMGRKHFADLARNSANYNLICQFLESINRHICVTCNRITICVTQLGDFVRSVTRRDQLQSE